ncbi:LLM class flavin-dependent oxidoreductase [Cellulomonas sp. ATA003]|uniref:LLM class flavin-dependent oxidoreductase n=1 Tax=Cellulomonas sp. ATA003 TaxID=3073064 RepID=UPI002873C606|nr:LLM class flavin-dependent oxidoreductase [Cellulomonas sp. ATA003]WNB87108.1 LLM class flavin-dependent oxidoreductase [Cellulomonas sp. ATA003]
MQAAHEPHRPRVLRWGCWKTHRTGRPARPGPHPAHAPARSPDDDVPDRRREHTRPHDRGPLRTRLAPEELPAFARRAEEQGYDELWFSEDLPWAGGIAMAATALAHTTRLRVGLGLLPAASRNVVTLAMDLAALERIAPGRLVVGLGHGVPAWLEQIGAAPTAPHATLEETTHALRRLLAGETVSVEGRHVRLDAVTLGYPPVAAPDVLLGTTGPRGLALAGRGAHGVILPEVTTPDAVRWARSATAAAGRPAARSSSRWPTSTTTATARSPRPAASSSASSTSGSSRGCTRSPAWARTARAS